MINIKENLREMSTTQKIAYPLWATGGIFSALKLIKDPYIFGKDTFLENHIGNFPLSVVLTAVTRSSISLMEQLISEKNKPKYLLTNKQRNALTLFIVSGLNFIFENGMSVKTEMVGDVAVGITASLLTLATFPRIKGSK